MNTNQNTMFSIIINTFQQYLKTWLKLYFMFLYRFDVLILKIIFLKKIILIY
jgi:hypothetical protein